MRADFSLRRGRGIYVPAPSTSPSQRLSAGPGVDRMQQLCGGGQLRCPIPRLGCVDAAQVNSQIDQIIMDLTNQHRIAEGVEPISLGDSGGIGVQDRLTPRECGDHHQQSRTRQVEICEHRVHGSVLESRQNE